MPQFFHHPQLTPHETALLLDERDCTISLLQTGELVTRQQFREQEWLVLNLFFREQGMFCTYEEALAALIGLPLVTCKERIQAARRKDEYEETVKHAFFLVMKPVREVLSGCQDRLHVLAVQISGLLDYGYVVSPYRPSQTLTS